MKGDIYGDLSGAAVVAEASGRKPKDERWTTLAIYAFASERLAVDHGAMAGRFVAEIVGETTIRGEERRVRRAAFATVAKALNWSAFNAKSALFDELRRKAIEWMGNHARDVAGLVRLPVRTADELIRNGSFTADGGWLKLSAFVKPASAIDEAAIHRGLATALGAGTLVADLKLSPATDEPKGEADARQR